ncbi:hypothetical protein ASC78_19725 [Variovorax sp. Root318D1]|uniref:hypothetical protein n=1 Tax=Variovorax sp. Root318D1 TaxID=1736513 RepID=UPI0006FFC605|nr:hypothetical protein [Variovorax sp. Root318D1]KQU90117.1 hypothetical protein ASC78_19725 [Variovorax sp. Root318D1]
MSKPEETPSPRNHALAEALAWISRFAHAWKAIEPTPHRLSIDGFIIWGPVLYEKHGKDDPVALAAQLYGNAGEYSKYLYPSLPRAGGEALPF